MRLSVRLTLAMTALVVCAVGGVGLLAYYNIGRAVVPSGLTRLAYQAKARLGAYETFLRVVRNELLSARLLPAHDGIARAQINGGRDPELGLTDAQWRTHVSAVYAANLQAKPGIVGYRLIGVADGGRSLIEVDRRGPGDSIRITAAADLPRRGGDDAFRGALTLTGDAVHFSPVRVVQTGVGDFPAYTPLVSISAPVRGPDGAVFAVLVIDLDLSPTFERIRAALDNDTEVYFVEADGTYMMNYTDGQVVPPERDRRWQDDFPKLAAALGDKPGTATVFTAPDGRRIAAAIVAAPLTSGIRTGVIETEPFDRIMAPATALQSSGLIVGLAAVIGAVLLSALLSRSLAKPVTRITDAVMAFSRTGRLAVPTGLGGESKILADAFAEMVGQIDRTTAALRGKSELLDQTIASMADAMVVIDSKGHRVLANPQFFAMFGDGADTTSEEWRRTHPRYRADGVTPLPEAESPVARARRGETFDNVELAFKPPGAGEPVHIAASGRTIENPDGSFGGAVIVYRNVNALKESERQLRQAQKMQAIGQLTGGVAHDLNNILTVVTGGIEIIADGVADRPELKEVATMVDQAVVRASDLTHGLLSFSRKQPLQPRSIDVNALMLDTVKLLRPTLGGGIEIEVEPSSELRPALADPSQLGSALINLAVNARDAMGGSGKLLLETGNVDLDQAYAEQHDEVSAGRYVMLAVSDNGCGIPAAIRDRVFEPFFTTKPVGEGTGLGLSMVYGFVKQSGGHIELYSEEGHGTTIRLYLPCATLPEPGLDSAAPPLAQGGRESVLVVEDDALVRSYVMKHLQALGYTAHSAASAAEAMAMVYDDVNFDLLFTDVMLAGGMNGPQLADELRRYKPGLKVLFTSGYTENAVLHHGRLDMRVHMLPKPYRRAELARMLRLVLDGRIGAPAK